MTNEESSLLARGVEYTGGFTAAQKAALLYPLAIPGGWSVEVRPHNGQNPYGVWTADVDAEPQWVRHMIAESIDDGQTSGAVMRGGCHVMWRASKRRQRRK